MTAIVAAAVFFIILGQAVRLRAEVERRGSRGRFDIPVAKMVWTILLMPKDKPEIARTLGVSLGLDPWRVNPNSLNEKRVIYNLITKSGFGDLGLLVLSSLVLFYVGAVAVTYALQWQWAKLKELSQAQVSIEIAGTVKIGAERGVIYLSKAVINNTQDKSELYGLSWLRVWVRVEYAY